MKALITGASSGIGREMAIYLSSLGYDLILASRDKEQLESLKDILKTKVKFVVVDLTDEKKVKDLYMIAKNEEIDLLINNAGFGLFGEFSDTDLSRELEMIDLNIRAVHILTKVFLKDMLKRGKGRILNVSSSAGLMRGGPLMSTYYATKSYVTSFSLALAEELRRKKANVFVSVLCPGPVDTNFNNVAGVRFSLKSMDAKEVARYGIEEMFRGKTLIVPSFRVRFGLFLTRFLSIRKLVRITYKIQRKKG